MALRLRRQTRRFLRRAVHSLVLATELFNRPHDIGRPETVVILLQNAFEMLLKGAIFERRSTVFEPGSRISHTFEKCLAIGRSDLGLLTEDMARQLRILDGLRDSATHYLVTIPEEWLYIHSRAAATLFDDLLWAAFGQRLADHLPGRVLPLSTVPLRELDVLVDAEFTQIREFIAPGKRRHSDARACLRHMAIVESNIDGQGDQPTEAELSRVIKRLRAGDDWRAIFPGVSSLTLEPDGQGPTFSLRITKQEGPPVRLARTPEEVEQAVFYREVNPQDRYPMVLGQLAKHLGITAPRTLALVKHLGIQADPQCFQPIKFRSSAYKCYSLRALERLRAALQTVDMEQVWDQHRPRRQTQPP
jgi:hypothetical protein